MSIKDEIAGAKARARHHREQATDMRKRRAAINLRCKERGWWDPQDRMDMLNLLISINERSLCAAQHDSRARELRAQLGPTTKEATT